MPAFPLDLHYLASLLCFELELPALLVTRVATTAARDVVAVAVFL